LGLIFEQRDRERETLIEKGGEKIKGAGGVEEEMMGFGWNLYTQEKTLVDFRTATTVMWITALISRLDFLKFFFPKRATMGISGLLRS